MLTNNPADLSGLSIRNTKLVGRLILYSFAISRSNIPDIFTYDFGAMTGLIIRLVRSSLCRLSPQYLEGKCRTPESLVP